MAKAKSNRTYKSDVYNKKTGEVKRSVRAKAGESVSLKRGEASSRSGKD